MSITHTLTSKGQITVPKQVRKHLGLKAGDRATFKISKDGSVVISKPPTIEEIRARLGKPDNSQPLSEREKLISDYLVKKYNVD